MNEQQQDQEHAELQHQQELEHQEWQEILRNDPEYAKWLDTFDSMFGGAR